MVTSDQLRTALWEIFFDKRPECEHLVVPLQGNWVLPTVTNADASTTWIGFTILNHRRRTQPIQKQSIVSVKVQTHFRVVFVGPQAEEWANSTLLWDVRGDVQDEFEKKGMLAQLQNDNRLLYTKVYEQEGPNSTTAWVLDMGAMSFYAVDTHQKPWVPVGDGGTITVP